MKRLFAKLRSIHRNQTGAILPILMMTSSIMIISGVAFLGVSSYEAKTVYNATSHIQAKYNAESAVRKALWRIENSPVDQWASVASFTDTASVSVYDTTAATVLGAGFFGGVTDTVEATVAIDSLDIDAQLGHIILYKKTLSVGPNVTLNYAAGNGPLQIRAMWQKWRLKHKLFDHANFADLRKHFMKSSKSFKSEKSHKSKKDWAKGKKVDYLYTYNNNQTFDGEMEKGIHYVKGNVELRDGTTLQGSIFATGSITMSGTVTITPMSLPTTSDRFGAYFPILVSMRDSDAEQEEEDDTVDMVVDNDSGTPNITLTGMVFSRRSVNFGNGVNLTGLILARNVYLSGNSTVTYDSKYSNRPPELYVDTHYKPKVTKWFWRFWGTYFS